MQTGTIYSIVCKVNGKRYIGQTIKSVSERWRLHLQESRTKSHRPLYRAIAKYGQGMFTVREIESDIPIDKLSEREIHWIEQFDTFNNGYNLTTGGETGSHISEEVKQQISETMSGKEKSPEHIAAISKGLKKRFNGKDPFNGKSGDGKHARRKVRATNIKTGEVLEYDSITEARKSIGINGGSGNISRAIKQKIVAYGYKWEKLDDKPYSNKIYGKRILDGKVIHHFKSEREAGRVLGSGSAAGLRKALKNPSRYSWKGCRWYYQPPE